MSEFRLLVATALRDIAQQLSVDCEPAPENQDIAPPPAPTPAPALAPPTILPPTPRAEPGELLFELLDDHRLPSGNFLIRVPPDPTIWQVFTIAGDLPAQGPARLLHRASIEATIEQADFIARAYRCILGRPADPDGLDHYGRALSSARLNRLEMIAELAASPEAGAQQRRLVILPETTTP
jgi:hypothetical protein